jgi:uncharacterized protein (TIGR00369 family)
MELPKDNIALAKWLTDYSRETSLLGTLGIEILEASPEKIVGTLPVGPKTHQPTGILHGGASVSLAEALASIGAWINITDKTKYAAVGLEINANHIRPKRDGLVTGEAIPLHRGRTTHVWDVRLYDEQRKLVCVSRCTIAIVEINA